MFFFNKEAGEKKHKYKINTCLLAPPQKKTTDFPWRCFCLGCVCVFFVGEFGDRAAFGKEFVKPIGSIS